jgi:hypothetical protein
MSKAEASYQNTDAGSYMPPLTDGNRSGILEERGAARPESVVRQLELGAQRQISWRYQKTNLWKTVLILTYHRTL